MCGVVGLIGAPDAAKQAFLGLTTLQHRGQDAAGILTLDHAGFHMVKNLGLVENVFTRENMESLQGSMAIGHVRYSTVGKQGDIADAQPLLLSYPYGLGSVHNGNIVNIRSLADHLKKTARRSLLSHSDLEVLQNLLADGLAKRADASSFKASPGSSEHFFEDLCASVKDILTHVKGSYSVVTMVADHGLVAFRDPHGIRPLVWGKKKGSELPSGEAHMLASESAALRFNDYEIVKDLAPGELLYIDLKGQVFQRVLDSKERKHCMFEWVYFASPESEIDQVPVYGARIQLGKYLARAVQKTLKEKKLEADLIIPVPETSRIASISLAEELGIPYRELLIKNRYIKRTFILDSQEKRQKAVRLKLSPVPSEIKGKRVILVDDSIVRGTTSTKIIELVRKAGASAVYFVSTCPPIRYPCYYGIDFPNREELVAHNRSQAEIEEKIGADAVIYQDLESLYQAIASAGKFEKFARPCMACLDGNYPADISAAEEFAKVRIADRQ